MQIILPINFYAEANGENVFETTPTISVGSLFTIGLTKYGTVIATGHNPDGRCNVSEWADIVTVSAGSRHVVGLKKDGAVVAIGNNDDNQCNVADWTDIIAVSAGNYNTAGLKKDGTVLAVGFNEDGQCYVLEWADIIAVSTGCRHIVGLKKDGTVVASGNNDYGQCNISDWNDIIAVSAGSFHTIGLKKDGTVVAVGDNYNGQCDVSEWTDIIAVSGGDSYTVGVKKNGMVIAVGSNHDGQCNVSAWTDITAVSTGSFHTAGLKKDGTVMAVGDISSQYDIFKWNLNSSEPPKESFWQKPLYEDMLNIFSIATELSLLAAAVLFAFTNKLKSIKRLKFPEINEKRRKTASILCLTLFIFSVIYAVGMTAGSIGSIIIPYLSFHPAEIFYIFSSFLLALFYLRIRKATIENYKRAITIILSLVLFSDIIGPIIYRGLPAFGSGENNLSSISSVISLFVTYQMILLIGIFSKKGTEKIAGVFILATTVLNLAFQYGTLSESFMSFLKYGDVEGITIILGSVAGFIFSVLPGIFLLIYPVLSEPILKRKEPIKELNQDMSISKTPSGGFDS